MKYIIYLQIFSISYFGVECSHRLENPIPIGENPGKPLFLTHLIDAGKIKLAQRLSIVKPSIQNTTSYSGYLTTNKKCGSNLFFWFFPAQENHQSAPLVLWLQGGPGITSMFGLFEELGPFNSFPYGLKTREYSWNVKNNLLFIDQPVGTGYSFTKKGCYADNQTAVGEDLYSSLVQFLKLFPDLQANKFYITGESFAGHYIPAIGHTIHNKNPTASLKINLAGLMIGNGWMDIEEQVNYGDFLYQTGFIDDKEREGFYHYENLLVSQLKTESWLAAYESWHAILGLIDKYSGVNLYNFLPKPADDSNWDQFIQQPSTRKQLHVGSMEFDKVSKEAHDHLVQNMMQSVKPWVEELLEHYPIVFYNGQVDIICAYPMMVNFLRSVSWSGQQQYLNATRNKWFVNSEIAGYVKGEYHLYDVLVRDAGHKVPADQPLWAFQLVNNFTSANGTLFSETSL